MQIIASGKAMPRPLLLKLLLIMKLTALFIIIATLHASAGAFAQKVTISGKNLTLDKVFRLISKETGLQFVYDQQLLEKSAPITLDVKDQPVAEVLVRCFNNRNLSFTIRNNAIVVYREPEVITSPDADPAVQNAAGDIKGTIVDSTGAPLAGANVIIEGTKSGTHTDNRGHFVLHNISDGQILVISYTGFESKRVKIHENRDLYIALRPSTQALDEQIVQAYGTTSRRFNVGSISKVSAEEITSQPVINPLAALEGRVAGLVVTTTSGNPGAMIKIQIRGQNSIGSTPGAMIPDNPLFIIDGVPFAPQNNSSTRLQTVDDIQNIDTRQNVVGGTSPFNSINPNDIESIEVLKDADATSIYGSRGANGVILITTKKGKATKTTLTGSVFSGIQHYTRAMPILNTSQYLKMRHQAFANDGLTPSSDASDPAFAPDLLVFDTTSHTDFIKELFGRNNSITSGNLSLSGGSTTNSFNLGASYNRQGYAFPGSFSDAGASGHVSLHHNSINRKFNVDLSTMYSYDHNNVPGSPSILTAYQLSPDNPSLLNPDGSLRWDYKGQDLGDLLGDYTNPLSYLKLSNNVQVYSLNTSLALSLQLFTGLTARVNLGYSTFNSNEYFKYPSTASDPADNAFVTATASNSNTMTWNIEPQLNYLHSFGKGKLNVLIGNTEQKNSTANLSASGSGFLNDDLLNSVSNAKYVSATQTYTPYKYSGTFGRINYIYNNEYILNLTGREDGSSRFRPGKQWGKFGAVGAGWIFTEEKFFKKALPALSFGKIRASYGTSGNDNVGVYQYVSNWTTAGSSYVYDGSIGYVPQNPDNPNYSWSTTKKLDAGIEAGLFNNRLLFTAAWYRNRSDNQLVQYPLPTQTGFASVTLNSKADIQNSGWEFTVSSTNMKSKHFTWTTAFNLSVARNKLLAFPGLASSPYSYSYVIGRSVSVVLGYKYAGINDTTGVYQFKTQKGQNTYTPSAVNLDNKFILGNSDPKYYGGMRNTFTYNRLSLDIFLEFKKQTGYNYQSNMYSPPGGMGNIPVDALNTWKHPGDHARYERLTSQSYGSPAGNVWQYYTQSSAVYGDASYIRVKTVGLNYAFDPELLKKAKISSMTIFFQAQNLFTITSYRGNDPESQSIGIPPMRAMTGGLTFNL